MVDKCELVVPKVGRLEFETIDSYIEILQESNSKAIPQMFIDGDNQNWIPPHQVCDIKEEEALKSLKNAGLKTI